MKRAMIALLPLLALAACSGGKDAPVGEAKTETSGPKSVADVAREVNAVRLEPGQWESEFEIVSMEMANAPKDMPPGMMDSMKGHTTKSSYCVTPEQAANPGADFLSGQKDSKCKYENFSMSGGKIAAAMTCAGGAEGPGKMKMTMNGSYQPTSYAMEMNMQSEGGVGGMGMTMAAKARSRRIGPCA